jgi:16S rRNA (guanine527-N7)-methyltransferase
MDATTALRALCARHGLGAAQARQLERILEALAGDPQAPSSVTEPVQAVSVHLADSLAALGLAAVREAGAAVDVGTGAGFPGLALAVALASCEVSLLESQERKCRYLERVVGTAGIANARVVCARAEQWREGFGAHDLATARALAPQPVVLEYAAPLLKLGGALVDWRGRRERAEEQAAARAAGELGLEPVCVERVQAYAGAREHHLHVFRKVAETPGRFPRRAGVARKRPLGR